MDDYDKNILLLESLCCRIIVENAEMLINLRVVDKKNIKSLEISATDVVRNYWESLITFNDFEDHQLKLGIIRQDWGQFFRLMYNSIINKDLSVEIQNQELTLSLNYQINVGKLKGSFVLHLERLLNRESIANLVFTYIEKLETRSLKRIREPSPEVPQLIAKPIQPKAKVVKKKNPKRIGSKIL